MSQRDNRAHISYLFGNIAPHLNHPDGLASPGGTSDGPVRPGAAPVYFFPPSLRQTNMALSCGGGATIKQYTLYDTSFIPLFDNSYSTDPISRAPIIMGKCSAQFQSHNFPFQL